jgi:hypothetical protein
MGRHSAAPGDEAEDAPVALAVDPAAARRGRHNRDEDLQDTGPVAGTEMRRLDERAAAQDAQPTELISLADLLIEPDRLAEPDAPDQQGPAAPAPESSAVTQAEVTEAEGEPAVQREPAAEGDAAVQREPAAEGDAAAKEKPAARGAHSTAADLALLRRHGDVRNRVIGAVLVPFVLYGAVMLLLGVTGVQYLLWIWIPLVSAGVLAGLILDAAHRHRPAAEDEPSG